MSETLAAGDGVKTYRGSSIEELLPRIREDLGPDAVILRRREGLVGGIGGFFQKRCIEVDARPGGPGIDVYDEEPQGGAADEHRPTAEGAVGQPGPSQGEGDPAGEDALDSLPPAPPAAAVGSADGVDPGVEPAPLRNDAATREGLESPAVQQIVAEAQPFADLLGQLTPTPTPPPGSAVPSDRIADERNSGAVEETGRTARAEALVEGMVAAGLGADLAAEIVDAVLASALPFATPARLRTLVRDQLALRLPVAPAAAPGRRAIALVGPAGAGKTAAVARICAAHAAAGHEVTCLAIAPRDGGAALRELLADVPVELHVAARDDGKLPTPADLSELHQVAPPGEEEIDALRGRRLLVVDTPAAWAGAEALPALAKALKALQLDEVHAVLRAGTAAPAGLELVAGLQRLRPNRLLATGLGEAGHLGAIADVAIRAELPLGYLAEGPAEIAPAEPRALASRIVP